MPLKVSRREGTEFFQVSGSVRGQRVRESTGTSDRRLAEEYRQKRERELYERFVHGDRATRTFGEAALSYLQAEERSPTTGGYVAKLIGHFGERRLADIDQSAVDRAYAAILAPGAAGATKLRAVLTPLKAIMEHAAVRGWCSRPAFETPKVAKSITAFLRPEQASALVREAAPHIRPLLVFLLGTGCRMSEALDLTWATVDLRGARAVVWQKQQNERHVDLPPVAVAALASLGHRDGYLFMPPVRMKNGRRFQAERYFDTSRAGGGQIKSAWATACRRAGLPGNWRVWTPKGSDKPDRQWVPDITPHDLRHTWASWNYCVHRDLLKLKAEGGWASVGMVERYAHLMPATYRSEILDWWRGGAYLTHATG